MLIGGILLGLLLGLRSGGRLTNLGSIQLRWVGLLFASVLVRFGTEILLGQGIAIVDTLRLPLLAAGFALLLVGLWVNRGYPGLSLAFVGILLNAVVIVRNGGFMPIWGPSLDAAGFEIADVTSPLHIVVPDATASEFLNRFLFLGDVIPIPLPIVQNVASLGDVFLSLGLAFFLFAERGPRADRPGGRGVRRDPATAGRPGRLDPTAATGHRGRGRGRDRPRARPARDGLAGTGDVHGWRLGRDGLAGTRATAGRDPGCRRRHR